MEINLFLIAELKVLKNLISHIEAEYSLELAIINSRPLEVFKSKLLAFIRPVQ